MDKNEQIREALRNIAKQVGPDCSLLAKVKSVDEDEQTCVLWDDDTELEFREVRLRPVMDGKESVTLFPKVGSWGLAIRIEEDNEWMLLNSGEIDKWRLSIGQTIIEQDAEGLLIKKENDTLRKALELIIEAVSKVVVIQGQNPDYVKLEQALTIIKNVLKDGT